MKDCTIKIHCVTGEYFTTQYRKFLIKKEGYKEYYPDIREGQYGTLMLFGEVLYLYPWAKQPVEKKYPAKLLVTENNSMLREKFVRKHFVFNDYFVITPHSEYVRFLSEIAGKINVGDSRSLMKWSPGPQEVVIVDNFLYLSELSLAECIEMGYVFNAEQERIAEKIEKVKGLKEGTKNEGERRVASLRLFELWKKFWDIK